MNDILCKPWKSYSGAASEYETHPIEHNRSLLKKVWTSSSTEVFQFIICVPSENNEFKFIDCNVAINNWKLLLVQDGNLCKTGHGQRCRCRIQFFRIPGFKTHTFQKGLLLLFWATEQNKSDWRINPKKLLKRLQTEPAKKWVSRACELVSVEETSLLSPNTTLKHTCTIHLH